MLDLDNGDLYLTKSHLITRTKNPLINFSWWDWFFLNVNFTETVALLISMEWTAHDILWQLASSCVSEYLWIWNEFSVDLVKLTCKRVVDNLSQNAMSTFIMIRTMNRIPITTNAPACRLMLQVLATSHNTIY